MQRLTSSEFASMFEASSHALWCIAAAILGDRALAEDALQDAAVIGLQKLDDFQPGTSFSAWMGQIVRNVSRNLARRRARGPLRAAADVSPDVLVADAPVRRETPVTAHGRLGEDLGSFDDRVLAALNDLGDTARACLLLRTVVGKSHREISEILDIPPGTAMSHVHRARRELRRRLSAASDRPSRGVSTTP